MCARPVPDTGDAPVDRMGRAPSLAFPLVRGQVMNKGSKLHSRLEGGKLGRGTGKREGCPLNRVVRVTCVHTFPRNVEANPLSF